MKTKTYWVGLSGIKTISGLGLSVTEAKVFLWYYVKAKTKRQWNGGSGREALLVMFMDVG